MLRPGAFLGEMALLTGEKRSANVTTASASLVVELTKDSIMSLATTNPEVLEKMTSAVAKRRLKNKEMEALSDEDKNEAIQNEEKNLMAKVTNFFFGS
jgi:CRP-like cAMP-binding protein